MTYLGNHTAQKIYYSSYTVPPGLTGVGHRQVPGGTRGENEENLAPDAEFGYYLAGLIEGDGSITPSGERGC